MMLIHIKNVALVVAVASSMTVIAADKSPVVAEYSSVACAHSGTPLDIHKLIYGATKAQLAAEDAKAAAQLNVITLLTGTPVAEYNAMTPAQQLNIRSVAAFSGAAIVGRPAPLFVNGLHSREAVKAGAQNGKP